MFLFFEVEENANRCYACPSYADCSLGYQIFPKMGYYVITTKSIVQINYSKLNKIMENSSVSERNMILTFSRYLFIMCERVGFKKTGCRLIFMFYGLTKRFLDKTWAWLKKIELLLATNLWLMKVKSTNAKMDIRDCCVLVVIGKTIITKPALLFVGNVPIITLLSLSFGKF